VGEPYFGNAFKHYNPNANQNYHQQNLIEQLAMERVLLENDIVYLFAHSLWFLPLAIGLNLIRF
jgi:hypothetical protein